MTFTITKIKLAIGVLAVALLVPATAMAVHSFDDVPDTAFYHDAVAWALANSITVGCNGGTAFCGQNTVTRGENITFAHRYDTNIVQPKFTTIDGTTTANSAAIQAVLSGTATIPSGTTVTGWDIWDSASIVDNQDVFFAIQLPARAPVALTSGTINFAPNAVVSDADATCTGTAAVPTAPAGQACLYVSDSSNVDGVRGHAADEANFADRLLQVGFSVDATTLGTDTYLEVTWAYTAP